MSEEERGVSARGRGSGIEGKANVPETDARDVCPVNDTANGNARPFVNVEAS